MATTTVMKTASEKDATLYLKWYHKLIFIPILAAVVLIFTLKLLFLITRYGITATSISCEQTAENSNLTVPVETKVNHEYIFTVIMYVIVNLLRIVEYLLLGTQFYHFLFKQTLEDPRTYFKRHSKRFRYLLLFFIVLLPYFLLGFAIPGLGIHQEIEHTERLEKCYRHYHEIYITYCAVNFLRYASAFSVRMWMIYTALFIDKLWFPDGPPSHTSIGLDKSKTVKRDIELQRTIILCNEHEIGSDNHTEPTASPNKEEVRSIGRLIHSCPNLSEIKSDQRTVFNNEHTIGSDAGSGASPNQECTSNLNGVELLICSCPNLKATEADILQDWKKVSTDFKKRYENYHKIGKQVQVYQELFQTWFIVPWIIYFINSSLKTYHVLRPWNADGDGDTPPSDIPSIYYLLFNIIQLITLIVPFLCAKKINTYHQKYFKHMRTEQIKRYEDHPSCLSFARQLRVERNDRYDFEPRLVGTSIIVSIGNPLFVILLLVGLLLSVSESLL